MSSQSQEKDVNPWKIVVVGGPVVVLVLIAALYSLFAYAFPQGKAQYAARYQTILKKLGPAPLPADRLALLHEVGALAGRKETSLPAVVMMVGVASDALRDRQVSDEERNNLLLVRDFAKSKAYAVGFDEMGAFLAEHPEVQKILEHRADATMKPAAQETLTTAGMKTL